MAASTDLASFIKGDTQAIPVDFTNDATPYDLTGWSLFFTAKYSPEQTDAEAVIRKEFPVTGTGAVITLTREDTIDLPSTNLYYNIELVSPSKDSYKTVVTGRMPLGAA